MNTTANNRGIPPRAMSCVLLSAWLLLPAPKTSPLRGKVAPDSITHYSLFITN
jgi:hypothetical protein